MRRNYAFLSSFFYTVSGLHFPLILPANQDPPQPADPNRTLPLRDKVACHPFPSPFPIFSPALGRDPSRTPDGGWDPSFPRFEISIEILDRASISSGLLLGFSSHESSPPTRDVGDEWTVEHQSTRVARLRTPPKRDPRADRGVARSQKARHPTKERTKVKQAGKKDNRSRKKP